MTGLRSKHEELNAEFTSRANSAYPLHYGRPLRTVQAIRNGVGLIEMPYDILRIQGEDRIEYVDNIISNTVPSTDGNGCYALLLDPDGKIRIDMYVYSTPDKLLIFSPPGTADDIAEEWNEKTFIQDVSVAD
ncbi:MAG: aminomethyl transferase family protein, partial [Halobacteriaceae archaeon]